MVVRELKKITVEYCSNRDCLYVLVRNVTLLLLLLLLTLCVCTQFTCILIILMLHYVLEHSQFTPQSQIGGCLSYNFSQRILFSSPSGRHEVSFVHKRTTPNNM